MKYLIVQKLKRGGLIKMNGSLQDVRRSLGQKVNSIRQNVMKQQGAGNKKQFLIMDSPVKKKSVPLRFKK